MKVELNKQQVENLLVITDRCQIQGNSAEAIVEIKKALRNALSSDTVSTTVDAELTK